MRHDTDEILERVLVTFEQLDGMLAATHEGCIPRVEFFNRFPDHDETCRLGDGEIFLDLTQLSRSRNENDKNLFLAFKNALRERPFAQHHGRSPKFEGNYKRSAKTFLREPAHDCHGDGEVNHRKRKLKVAWAGSNFRNLETNQKKKWWRYKVEEVEDGEDESNLKTHDAFPELLKVFVCIVTSMVASDQAEHRNANKNANRKRSKRECTDTEEGKKEDEQQQVASKKALDEQTERVDRLECTINDVSASMKGVSASQEVLEAGQEELCGKQAALDMELEDVNQRLSNLSMQMQTKPITSSLQNAVGQNISTSTCSADQAWLEEQIRQAFRKIGPGQKLNKKQVTKLVQDRSKMAEGALRVKDVNPILYRLAKQKHLESDDTVVPPTFWLSGDVSRPVPLPLDPLVPQTGERDGDSELSCCGDDVMDWQRIDDNSSISTAQQQPLDHQAWSHRETTVTSASTADKAWLEDAIRQAFHEIGPGQKLNKKEVTKLVQNRGKMAGGALRVKDVNPILYRLAKQKHLESDGIDDTVVPPTFWLRAEEAASGLAQSSASHQTDAPANHLEGGAGGAMTGVTRTAAVQDRLPVICRGLSGVEEEERDLQPISDEQPHAMAMSDSVCLSACEEGQLQAASDFVLPELADAAAFDPHDSTFSREMSPSYMSPVR